MDMQNFIDLTSLGGDDTNAKITDLCSKAIENKNAAVCVFQHLLRSPNRILMGDYLSQRLLGFSPWASRFRSENPRNQKSNLSRSFRN